MSAVETGAVEAAVTPCVSWRRLALYGLPVLGSTSMFWLVNVYLLKFATSEVGVAPAVMGGLFGLARLADALSDPLVGTLSDRTRHRLGRRRPWILASALPIGLAFVALWSPPSEQGAVAGAIWLGVALTAFYAAFTAFNVPHAALGAELSEDHHERTRVFGVRAGFEVAGIGLGLVALHFVESARSAAQAATTVSLALGLLTACGIAAAAMGSRERAEYQGRAAPGALRALRDVARNRHARRLLAVFFLSELGLSCLMVTVPFASEVLLRDEAGSATLLMQFLVPMALAVPLTVPLSRRFGKARTWFVAQAIVAVALAGVFFVGAGNALAVAVLAGAIGVASAASRTLPASIQADVIDYDEMQTGERKEGAYLAAWNLAGKSGAGFAVVIAGVVLQVAGVRDGAAADPANVELGIRIALAALPAAFVAASTWLLAGFELDEVEHRRVRAAIAPRVAPVGSVAEPG